jgi:hypothetical protein
MASAQLSMKDASGRELAVVEIRANEGSAATLITLEPVAAYRQGEEPIQLIEGCSYEYRLSAPGFRLDDSTSMIGRSLFADTHDEGVITPGNRVGRLVLPLLDVHGERVGMGAVEVRSRKLSYREDFRSMIEALAEQSVDLVLSLKAPTQVRVDIASADAASVQQHFFFLRSLLESRKLDAAVQQVLAQPHSQLKVDEQMRDPRRGIRLDSRVSRELAHAHPRQPLPAEHPLARRLAGLGVQQPSIPFAVTERFKSETLDTAENRFVKHVLRSFDEILGQIASRLQKAGEDAFVEREVRPLRRRITDLLGAGLFAEVSTPQVLPLGSPVLQRKAGYREVYQTWIRFQAAARLSWRASADLFSAGQRDVATLYEYWLFMFMLDVLRLIGVPSAEIARSVLSPTADGFGLKIQAGELFETSGFQLPWRGRGLALQLSYNRTFVEAIEESRQSANGVEYRVASQREGSWTRRFRPDFTLSIWPADTTLEEAAEMDLLVHVHFDAKYSVSSISELFGASTMDLNEEKQQQRSGRYRRGDLLKMHAYKDAIKRSEGAYVLYPGESQGRSYDVWARYHEILPGVGAFMVRPGPTAEASRQSVAAFVRDVMSVMVDRIESF